MTKSELFKKAHEMTRTTIAKLGGNYLVTFAQALKEVYKKATEVECFRIKSWFMAKNEDKFGDLDLDPNFAKRDIIKETAKAYQIRLQALTKVTVTKLVWVPKSVCEAYSF